MALTGTKLNHCASKNLNAFLSHLKKIPYFNIKLNILNMVPLLLSNEKKSHHVTLTLFALFLRLHIILKDLKYFNTNCKYIDQLI